MRQTQKMLLGWDDKGCQGSCRHQIKEHLCGERVPGGGAGVVSHAGLVLLRHLADKTGLTSGLSRALASPRILVPDRGPVLADLACSIADGARVLSDFRVMGDQRELFGLVAAVPMAWRTLQGIPRGGRGRRRGSPQRWARPGGRQGRRSPPGMARCQGYGWRTRSWRG